MVLVFEIHSGTLYSSYKSFTFCFPLEPCGIGEIHISKTMGCTGYGYTCLLDKDGPQCCGGRYDKTPTCEKCDNTVSKKPDGGYFYTTPGACDYLPGKFPKPKSARTSLKTCLQMKS